MVAIIFVRLPCAPAPLLLCSLSLLLPVVASRRLPYSLVRAPLGDREGRPCFAFSTAPRFLFHVPGHSVRKTFYRASRRASTAGQPSGQERHVDICNLCHVPVPRRRAMNPADAWAPVPRPLSQLPPAP